MPFPNKSAYECARTLNELEAYLQVVVQITSTEQTAWDQYGELLQDAGFQVHAQGDIDLEGTFGRPRSVATRTQFLGRDADGVALLKYAQVIPGRYTIYRYYIDPFGHADYAPT